MSLLAVFHVLQSIAGEPTRDKELSDIVLNADDKGFILLATSYLRNVSQRTVSMKVSTLNDFLEKLAEFLVGYRHQRDPAIQLFVIHLLQTTMHIWIPETVDNGSVGGNVQQLCAFLTRLSESHKLTSWSVRDAWARFLGDYIAADPRQGSWPTTDNSLPSAALPMMGRDEDIRVQFRVATLNPRLLCHARQLGMKADQLYTAIRDHLCKSLDE